MGYRCKAVNMGPNELSDVQITCAGKMASTKFLPPHKELYLDGVLVIENNTELSAGVQGKDAKGSVYTNNTSTPHLDDLSCDQAGGDGPRAGASW